IYKNRNWDMIGLDGNVYGNCIPFPNHDIQCSRGLWSVGGKRMFRCLTRFTVYDFIAANGGRTVG
ncbi:uncharacterized protein CC84DRAFT_1079851, partial [Paraphaeosphaeria sporulosa]